ncbi:FAD-dependent oxidoreductase [Nonomuraea sp. NPDC000554]|uniref:NAD(P)/FAD-dependent oxidoreductase n=1 Tax=Nonomuraea sp. NPDC000554 TaxID=3154259 RepID=UPI0033335157
MTHRIVVLGAGYAGLGAAKRAARRLRGTGAQVTLVNAADRFVERIRLHQLATGQKLLDLPLTGLLDGTGVDLVVARVTGLDLPAREVRVDAAPYTLGYDTLVYALGSGADLDTVPGVREHAFSVAAAGEAARLRSQLPGLSSLTVVGGGLTGIETAAELAAARPGLRVELVTGDRIGAGLSERARRHLHSALGRMGVAVREHAVISKVGPDSLQWDDGGELPAEAVVWTAGFRVPGLAAASGLATDESGRILVDRTLRSVSHPEVLGIGDAAQVPDDLSRMSCQTALPMGMHAGVVLADLATGRPPRPVRIRYVWQNISLGRLDGVTQFTRADDSPLGDAVLTGRASARFKEAVSRGTVALMRYSGLPSAARR